MVIAIIGDWDADGVIATAEIFYSQGVLGLYPVKGRRDVVLVPASTRSIDKVVSDIIGQGIDYTVILDIAYSKYADKALSLLNSKGIGTLYVDHHISTAINLDRIKSMIENIVVGKISTAMLVYNLLRSAGINISERLRTFVEAVTVMEKGGDAYRIKHISRKLIDIVASISRTLVYSKDRDLWVKVIKWLVEPLPTISMPFATDVKQFIRYPSENLKEIKALASELALSAIKIFNVRLIDARGRRLPFKSTVIASAIHRLLKAPIALLSKNKYGKDLLILKSDGVQAYDIALYLYRKGFAEDIMGHQTLVILLLKPGVDKEEIVNSIREAVISGPAGI